MIHKQQLKRILCFFLGILIIIFFNIYLIFLLIKILNLLIFIRANYDAKKEKIINPPFEKWEKHCIC